MVEVASFPGPRRLGPGNEAMVEGTHTNPTNINTALCINSRAIGSGTGRLLRTAPV